MTGAPSLADQAEGIFAISQAWRSAYPDAHAGVLVMRDAANLAQSAALDKRKIKLEADLRARYAGQDRAALRLDPVLKAYEAYYRRFNKTYHVQLQLESIVVKGKPIPSGAALVEAMFMAEIENLLLTAGHDLDAIRLPLTLDVAQGTETYILLRGEPQVPKAGDMMIHDAEGITSSIVYGPDRRTQITEGTRNVVFTVYGPEGIAEAAIQHHLEQIRDYVRLVQPTARVELMRVYGAA